MEEQVERLMSYCTSQKIGISSAIRAKYSNSSGIGLHAASSIKQGQLMIHAPTSALLTTTNIPTSFLAAEHIREDLTVHGLLACWLAFGEATTLQERYGPWMNVWPSWPSFRDSMPIFWQAHLKKSLGMARDHQAPQNKKRKVSADIASATCSNKVEQEVSRDFSLSPAIEGWLPPPLAPTHKTLRDQITKITEILLLLHNNQDLLGFDILGKESHEQYEKFLHMWCCVNSRCFYYVPPGTKAPKDPNEAMALVPFLDLFNHTTEGPGAEVKVDKRGFDVIAEKDYVAGEEIFIQYGSHSNDALWIEYGFMLDDNDHDELNLDQLVLNRLNEEQKELLVSTDYLGEYTLTASEVSYRMEMVAWLASDALSPVEWESTVQGVYDLEAEDAEKYEKLKSVMMKKVATWIAAAQNASKKNLCQLLPIQNDTKEGKLSFLSPPRDTLPSEMGLDIDTKAEIADKRLGMCVKRWQQIDAMCTTLLEKIAADHPTAVGKQSENQP